MVYVFHKNHMFFVFFLICVQRNEQTHCTYIVCVAAERL